MIDGYRMVVRQFGGPEAIEREAFRIGSPGPGEVLIETEAVGLNFIDTYYRKGLYPASVPFCLGSESAGRVIAVGDGVSTIVPGDRIATVRSGGAYASHRLIPADEAVKVPAGVDAATVAAILLKGLTTSYLTEETYVPAPGQIALVHSAAGGVGSLLVPWLIDKGVTVIAHAGTPEKAAGIVATHALSCPFDALADAVRDITGGALCDVVYDGVGATAWQASIASLKKRGMMVSFGNSSGPVPPVSLLDIMRAGSLYVTRPTLFDYIATNTMLTTNAGRLFDRLQRGVIQAAIGQTFPLGEAAEAHRALEGRQTTGSTILLP
ncbi:quinone oxidoreductase [Novosphingobium colocasiae]|uniref:quinone oxidoreductase family protein n=1 Tax=Novosphingobium colocasiae TaxID=1256513 RepID=UPI0035B37323